MSLLTLWTLSWASDNGNLDEATENTWTGTDLIAAMKSAEDVRKTAELTKPLRWLLVQGHLGLHNDLTAWGYDDEDNAVMHFRIRRSIFAA